MQEVLDPRNSQRLFFLEVFVCGSKIFWVEKIFGIENVYLTFMKLYKILFEGIRFDVNRLKGLRDIENIVDYVEKTGLRMVGRGSSREVYILSSKYALKLARFEDNEPSRFDIGIAQNEAEKGIWDRAGEEVRRVLPKVYSGDSNGYWLIVDLVRPLRDSGEFKELSGGISLLDFKEIVEMFSSEDIGTVLEDNADMIENEDVSSLLVSVGKLVQGYSVNPLEVGDVWQWGKTSDGRLVLLDSGGTEEVLDQYY